MVLLPVLAALAAVVVVAGSPPSPDAAADTHVCLLTYALVGPIKTGGVATAMTALAETLAAARGVRVTVLYMFGEDVQSEDMAFWRSHYKEKKGIDVVSLDHSPAPEDDVIVPAAPSTFVERAFRAYEWVRAHACDVVHAHEWHGPAYFVAVAKAQGVALQHVRLITTVHCPSLFFNEGSNQLLNTVDVFVGDHLEREQTRLSDTVVSPSAFMLEHAQQAFHWTLPPPSTRVQVLQNVLSASVLSAMVPRPVRQAVTVREFVFFARIEKLKGVFEFCDALDRLGEKWDKQPPRFDVTFMGNDNMPEIDAPFYLRTRSHRWKPMLVRPVQVFTNKLQPDAVQYLREKPGRVAIMPSLAENSPYAVLECLALGLPFLSSRVGGVAELIGSEDDRRRVLFEPTPEGILATLERALDEGVVRASLAHDPRTVQREWVALTKDAVHTTPHTSSRPPPRQEREAITVCIVSHNRGRLLLQAVQAVLAQTRPATSIHVVDTASDDAETQRVLTLLEEFLGAGHVTRLTDNAWPGRARNRCVRDAVQTPFVAFLDDDDVPQPQWLDTLFAVAARTRADVVTSGVAFFEGEGAPHPSRRPRKRWIPLGGDNADIAFVWNVHGSYSALWRTTVFRTLGGFSDAEHALNEDWELFSRAVLAGRHLESVPEPLVWYRQGKGGRDGASSDHLLSKIPSTLANRLRPLEPYLKTVPRAMRNVLLFALGTVKDVEAVTKSLSSSESD